MADITREEFDRRKAAGELPEHAVYEDGKIVVAGIASLVGHGALGSAKQNRAALLQDMATEAVKLALSEGHSVYDTETILAYKQYARAVALKHLGDDIEIPPRPEPKTQEPK